MHPERVIIARVVVVVPVAVVIGISAAIRTFRSLLLGHLFPIEEVIVLLPAAAHKLGLWSSE
jgi:hypothetical protein